MSPLGLQQRKKPFLNGERTPKVIHLGSTQREQEETSISGKGFNCILSQLPKGLVSNWPASWCSLGFSLWDTDGSWSTLAYWEWEEQRQQLGPSQIFERHSGAQARLTSFISYKRLVCQEWKTWLFYLMYRNQHRGSKKMKKKRICSKPNNEIKALKNLNEWELGDLPNGEFNIMAHWGQESNAWAAWEF